jgi:hypothetical protein
MPRWLVLNNAGRVGSSMQRKGGRKGAPSLPRIVVLPALPIPTVWRRRSLVKNCGTTPSKITISIATHVHGPGQGSVIRCMHTYIHACMHEYIHAYIPAFSFLMLDRALQAESTRPRARLAGDLGGGWAVLPPLPRLLPGPAPDTTADGECQDKATHSA